MFARLTTLQGSPDRVDDAVQFIEQRVVPGAKEQAGFRGGYWGLDRSTGKGFALTLWESEQTMQDSDAAFGQRVREEGARDLAAQTVSVETYEVVAQS
jgi:heme-degrading monooxygenase HmoA